MPRNRFPDHMVFSCLAPYIVFFPMTKRGGIVNITIPPRFVRAARQVSSLNSSLYCLYSLSKACGRRSFRSRR